MPSIALPNGSVKVARINRRKYAIHHNGRTIALTKQNALDLCNALVDLIESQEQ